MASLENFKPHTPPKDPPTPTVSTSYPFLAKSLSFLKSEEEVDLLLRSLCVHQEYENINLRLKIVYYLKQGYTYEKIREILHCSISTISFISRRMQTDSVGYDNLFEILKREHLFPKDPTDESTDESTSSISPFIPSLEDYPSPEILSSSNTVPKGGRRGQFSRYGKEEPKSN